MQSLRRSPLFSAVVLAGASLTTGCGSTSNVPADTVDAKAPADAATEGDAATSPDSGDAATCPPGSERPVPPCALIK